MQGKAFLRGREDWNTSFKPSWSWMRAEGMVEEGGYREGLGRVTVPSPAASRRPLLAGLQPLDLKECLSRPVVGARADDIAAKSLGRAGHCPAHWLGPAVDSQCHSSLPLNHCVCPVGTHPSERLWAINGEHCPRNPPASSSCSQPPPYPRPASSWEKDHKGISEGCCENRGLREAPKATYRRGSGQTRL